MSLTKILSGRGDCFQIDVRKGAKVHKGKIKLKGETQEFGVWLASVTVYSEDDSKDDHKSFY